MARWAFFVGALGLAIRAAGEPTKETLPYFGHLANAKENSALSMECDGDPLGTIECQFIQVTVSAYDTAEVEQARMAVAEELRRTPPGRKEMRRDMCALKKPVASEQAPQRAAVTARFIGAISKACACQDDPCFDREIIEALLIQDRKCRVWTHTFKASLTRVLGQRKWIGTAESGLCRDVNATVIESDDKGLLWRFTQTRLTTDSKASDFCKDRKVNEPAIYSWDVDSAAVLNCEVVKFGH